MQNEKIQYVLEQLKKELHRFIDTIGEIPYVALPSEKPEIICFAGKIKELTGYDANEILVDREHWANMIHPDDCERVFAAFAGCKNEGMPFNIGYRIVHKNGSLRYVNDKGEPVFDNKGEITQVEGVITPLGEGTKPESIPLLEIKEVPTYNNVNSNCFQNV
jgi:PAS domain S-box-containing protein